MRAVVATAYGSPDILQIRELEKPTPKDNEVLIRVRATTVTTADWRARSLNLPPGFGLMGRLMFGLAGPRQPILGAELAGEIESIGKDVTRFGVGDQVFAFPGAGMGSHAEYRTMREDGAVARKPANLTFEEAAAISFGGTTALSFFRRGNIQPGEKMLINGASGGVGTAAVQLAKHFGAHVTGVCSTANVELVRSIGADEVIDYTKEDFSANGERYDIIMDTAGTVPFSRAKASLRKGGRLLQVLGGLSDLLQAPWASLTTDKRVIAGPAIGRAEDLRYLAELAEAGKFKPVIDRRYPFEQMADAHGYVDRGHKKGNVVICLVLAVFAFALTSSLGAQGRPYAEVVPATANSERGLFNVHRAGANLLFEIPDSLLGRDMIIMSRYGQVQDGLSQVGANMAPNLVVRWERRGDRVYLRAASHQTTADSGTARSIAVEHQNFAPVLQSFPVAARGERSSVIDVTDLYLAEHPAFTLQRAQRAALTVRRYERDRSWLEFARTFPTNVEVRVVQSYSADQPPSNARGGAVSFEVNHSMIVLPATPMMPRIWDERVGFISVTRTNYSRDFQGVRPEQYIRKYRLEPSDTAAFLRGELVEPVKPWVWYIDPATPEKWVSYIKAGILEWNAAFEDAGFRNAIQVRRAPTPRQDPAFSLLDARHSVLRYVPTTVRSANSGGDVVDPRSGEVLRAHTNMYEAVAERMRWQLLSQVATAADDKRYRSSRLPDDLMGEAIRYVTSHETAHSVGLPHNQRANFVFPVDSIRNPDFVRRMGHSGSSVGRTRFNYAAQPGDGVPPERRMGVWDRWAVYWGYRPIIGAKTTEDETSTLHQWITDRADKPWFRFASAQFGMDQEWDPYRMTEGISADPVEAASLGMKNLKVMVDSLLPWLLREGDDYYELETHYLQALTQWNRYAEHAAAAIGGSWTHHKRYGEPGVVYTAVEPAYQRKAMKFIDDQVLATPSWALDANVLRRLEHAGAVERIRAYQELAVQRLLNHARIARMIEHEAFHDAATYRPAQMLDDARAAVWRDARAGRAVDTYRRNLQRAYIAQANHLLNVADNAGWSPPRSGDLRVGSDTDPRLNGELKVAQSDIRPLIRDQLKLLRGELRAALTRGVPDRNTRIHLEDAVVRIDKALEP